MIYVMRGGRLVPKAIAKPRKVAKNANFPTPRISRMEPYESPITGKEISSWGERDREMRDHDCYDPRDMSPNHVYQRGRDVPYEEVPDERSDFEWR